MHLSGYRLHNDTETNFEDESMRDGLVAKINKINVKIDILEYSYQDKDDTAVLNMIMRACQNNT